MVLSPETHSSSDTIQKSVKTKASSKAPESVSAVENVEMKTIDEALAPIKENTQLEASSKTTVQPKVDESTSKTAVVHQEEQTESLDTDTQSVEITAKSEQPIESDPTPTKPSFPVMAVEAPAMRSSVSGEDIQATTAKPTLDEMQQRLLKNHRYQEEVAPPPTPSDDFLAPHSMDAEEALLGSLLTNPDMYDEVAPFLNADDFFFLRNSWIYEAIQRIRGREEAVDHVTVVEELRAIGRVNEVGASYPIYLLNNAPISRHAVVYGRIVERAAIRRRLIGAAGKIATIAFSENRDIHEVINDSEMALADVTEQRSSQQIVGNFNSPNNFLSELQHRIELQDTDGVTGVRLGYRHLDQLMGGLQSGELYVVAGRSKSGKSAFMLNMTRGAAANGSNMGFFSLEMNLTQLQRRLHAMETGINTQKMRLGAVSGEEYEQIAAASRRIQSYNIFWDETPRISMLELRTKCRFLKRRYDVNTVMIDYLQLLKPPEESLRRDNRERQLATMAEMLKEMARELNMAVVVAAQLNREMYKSDDKRPRIEHIRGSDAIVHNADVVMLWHCPQTIDEHAPKTGASKLYIEKHRDGPQTELDFRYELGCQRIREVEFETVDLSNY